MKVRFSVFGNIVRITNGDGTVKEKFDWINCIIDASIMSGITTLSTYISTQNIQSSLLAGGLSWLMFVGMKRGLIKHE